jgi:hypothetical protein
MNLIFLDFDGVLHAVHCDPKDYFCRLPILEDALVRANAQIVVSSSWRFHFSTDEILQLFPFSLRRLIVGFTGEAHVGSYARYNEIKTYAELNGEADWLVIDDSRFEFPPHFDRLILCDGKVGISEKEVDLLGKRLSGAKR